MRRRRLAPSLLALASIACGAADARSASAPSETPAPAATEAVTPEATPSPRAEATTPAPIGGPIRIVTPLWVATATPHGTPPPAEEASRTPAPPVPVEPRDTPRPLPTRPPFAAPVATGTPAASPERIGGPVRMVTPLWVATATPGRRATPEEVVAHTPVPVDPVARPEATWTASPTPTAPPDPCPARIYEQEPAEPFDWIGIVEVQRKRPSDRFASLLESARQSACRLGGDGIIVIYRAKRRPGGLAERPQPGMLPNVDVRAVVIRFRR